MNIFVEGELVVMQHASYYEEWNGAVAVVVGGLAMQSPMNLHTMEPVTFMGYQVMPLVEGGFKVTCEPHQLRKLREPGTDERQQNAQQARKPDAVIVR